MQTLVSSNKNKSCRAELKTSPSILDSDSCVSTNYPKKYEYESSSIDQKESLYTDDFSSINETDSIHNFKSKNFTIGALRFGLT